jgi:hypothetical protein
LVSSPLLELTVNERNICSANWRAWEGEAGAGSGLAPTNTGGSLTSGFAVDELERERFTSTVNGLRGVFMVMGTYRWEQRTYRTLSAFWLSVKQPSAIAYSPQGLPNARESSAAGLRTRAVRNIRKADK